MVQDDCERSGVLFAIRSRGWACSAAGTNRHQPIGTRNRVPAPSLFSLRKVKAFNFYEESDLRKIKAVTFYEESSFAYINSGGQLLAPHTTATKKPALTTTADNDSLQRIKV